MKPPEKNTRTEFEQFETFDKTNTPVNKINTKQNEDDDISIGDLDPPKQISPKI